MELAQKILFGIFLVTFISGNLMIFIFKKPNTSLGEMYWKGSFILRELNQYVLSERIPQIKFLLTTGAVSFLAFVLVTLSYAFK